MSIDTHKTLIKQVKINIRNKTFIVLTNSIKHA